MCITSWCPLRPPPPHLQADKAHPLLSSLRTIASSEGLGALFRGWSARSAKAAPACAIVLSSYEMIKHIGDHA